MKLGVLLVLTLMLFLPIQTAAQTQDYSQAIRPSWYATPLITWDLTAVPEQAFGLFWSGSGTWLAQIDSYLTLEIESVGEDVVGKISLGNATWRANDTDLARDLAIGVWGLTPWLPGFLIPVTEESVHELNQTAYASASRIPGNYMNGTMHSYYDTLLVNGRSFDCIVFEYVQDDTGFGDPQCTQLAYDLTTGILVNGSTTYSFGIPYALRFRLESLTNPREYLLFGSLGIIVLAGTLTYVNRLRGRRKTSRSS